jgi:hypothetical protein
MACFPRLELFCLVYLTAVVSAVGISVLITAPAPAVPVSPSLVSLSIEQDRWTDWVGNTTSNTFFYNTINNLKGISGEAPWIRIGANCEDHTDFDPLVQAHI